jgi:hypothetical protein
MNRSKLLLFRGTSLTKNKHKYLLYGILAALGGGKKKLHIKNSFFKIETVSNN